MARNQEYQAPGSFPQNYDSTVDDPNLYGGLLGRFFEGLKRFLLGANYFKSIPKPFDFMTVQEFLIPLGGNGTWLDGPNVKLSGRRAWALINTDPVAGNNVWVSSAQMTAAGQGGRVLALGGTVSVPGSEVMNVWCFTNVAAGVTVGFYQFA